MRIAIIGAGFTGLTAAYRLCQKGHKVTLLEKESLGGGLAGGFKEKGWDWHLENFFHHLFASDQAAKNLIRELDLFDKLFYVRAKTSILKGQGVFQFDSPTTLLTSPHLSFLEKARVGAIIAYLKTTSHWRPLEKTTASSWLNKTMGENAYRLLWQPLLQGKFAKFANQIPMSWFWARIKKRSPRLGYLKGGFQILIDRLVKRIKENGGEILLDHEIKNLDEFESFDRIIVTTPTEIFLNLAPGLPKDYKSRLEKLKMLGALNLILVLKEKFLTDGTYWLNIDESGFPFVAVVEHTNFVEPKYYGGKHLVYIGGYYPQNHRYFKMNKERVFKEFLPYLQKINPKFNQLSVVGSQLSANLFAQPIIPVNYSQLIPPFKTPVPNLFLANMQMVYPWDRGVNYAIELGEMVVNEVLKDI